MRTLTSPLVRSFTSRANSTAARCCDEVSGPAWASRKFVTACAADATVTRAAASAAESRVFIVIVVSCCGYRNRKAPQPAAGGHVTSRHVRSLRVDDGVNQIGAELVGVVLAHRRGDDLRERL